MGLRGPPPKPTALRKLDGNPSGRPLNPYEPKPRILPSYEPPAELSQDGRRVWDALTKELVPLGLLTTIDLEPFYRYVKFVCEYREMDDKIKGVYVISIKDENGKVKYMMANPYVSMRNQLALQLSRLEAQFGMTPSARARMIGLVRGDTPPAGDDDDPYGA